MNLRKLGLGLVACGCLADMVLAEKNGVYTSFGFQYSQVKTTVSSVGSGFYRGGVNQFNSIPLSPSVSYGYANTYGQSNMYGFDLDIGYKVFFGKSKRNGLSFLPFMTMGIATLCLIRRAITSMPMGRVWTISLTSSIKRTHKWGSLWVSPLRVTLGITQGHPVQRPQPKP